MTAHAEQGGHGEDNAHHDDGHGHDHGGGAGFNWKSLENYSFTNAFTDSVTAPVVEMTQPIREVEPAAKAAADLAMKNALDAFNKLPDILNPAAGGDHGHGDHGHGDGGHGHH